MYMYRAHCEYTVQTRRRAAVKGKKLTVWRGRRCLEWQMSGDWFSLWNHWGTQIHIYMYMYIIVLSPEVHAGSNSQYNYNKNPWQPFSNVLFSSNLFYTLVSAPQSLSPSPPYIQWAIKINNDYRSFPHSACNNLEIGLWPESIIL